MNEWQLIEAAPKDGTKILGFADGEMATVEWIDLGAYWSLVICGAFAESGEWWPTHWMPLPMPPNT